MPWQVNAKHFPHDAIWIDTVYRELYRCRSRPYWDGGLHYFTTSNIRCVWCPGKSYIMGTYCKDDNIQNPCPHGDRFSPIRKKALKSLVVFFKNVKMQKVVWTFHSNILSFTNVLNDEYETMTSSKITSICSPLVVLQHYCTALYSSAMGTHKTQQKPFKSQKNIEH